MDATNGSSASKAPVLTTPEGEPSLGGFQAQHKMAVQPPKQEDLQRTYATIVTEEASPNDWYGKMSTYSDSPPPGPDFVVRLLTPSQHIQLFWRVRRYPRCHPRLHLLPQPV
jgi:hypothetical protein